MSGQQFGVIFDMDGVLIDSYLPHFISWQETASGFGLHLSEEEFRTTFGQTSVSIIRQLWGEGILSPEQILEFDRIKESRYREMVLADLPLMRGAETLVDALAKENVLMAIGSSGPPENVQLVTEALGGDRVFRASVTGKDVKHGKPDPQVFLMAAAKLGLESVRCVVIEDAPVGVEAALRAGMKCVGLQSPAPRQRDLGAAQLVVDSLDQLSPGRLLEVLDL